MDLCWKTASMRCAQHHIQEETPSKGEWWQQMDHAGKKTSAWPRKRQAQMQLYWCTAASRAGQWAAPGRSLQGSQNWVQNGQTPPPRLNSGELQTLMQGKEGPVPFELQLFPLPYCEGHSNPYEKQIFKAEFTAPLQNSMLDATKFILFLYLFSLSAYIVISGPLRFCVVILTSLLFILHCGDSSLHFATRNQKSPQQFY